MIKILLKTITILLISILLLNMFANVIYAAIEVNSSKAYIEKIGEADQHLKYYREDRDIYTYLICSIVGYYYGKSGIFYPAYCMNRDLVGAENESYYVKVESLLKNNKVWRVIKNGYPYKSAAEMGLSSKYNAFAVTKFAVYCMLGEAKLKYFKAEEDDKEAVAMLKALKKLVKIGEEGTEKQDDDPLSLKKVGNIKEEGNYYVQEYNLESTADFNKYEVTQLSGAPEGTLISDIKGNEKKVFNSEDSFKIKIPKKELKKDLEIKINAQAECKSYVILEGKTTVTKTQNYVITAGEFTKATTSSTLKINVNTASININKIEEGTKIPIEGVKFELYKDKKLIDTKQTDTKGKLKFENLYPGNYIVKEKETNKNYVLDTTEHNIELEYNEGKDITILNKRKTGNIKVYKVDKDDKETKLEGVEFDIYSEDLKKIIGTYVTDKNGEINVQNLPIGEYKIIEKKANKWYNMVDEVSLKVKYNQTTETTIVNELKKGQIKIIKVDEENNEIRLEGIKFEVQDKDGKVLETLITDKNGEATTSKYAIKDYEYIYLKEIQTNNKYVLDDSIKKIKLEENQTKDIVFKNKKIKGKIKIIKTSKDYNKINGKKAGTPLEDVIFEIYDENNKLVQEVTTDINGIAMSKYLEKGEYTVKEKQTNKYYYLNREIFNANIENNDEIVTINVINESQNPNIDVEKTGPEKVEIGKQIEYDISIRNTGNTLLENFTFRDILPSKYIKVNKFRTGTYNQELKYNLYYKTSMGSEYILLMEGLSTKENYEIDFLNELADNEDLVEIKLEFGTVDIGFNSNENPHIIGTVKKTVKSEEKFKNIAELSGEFEKYKVYDKSKWKTLVYKLLPKTGI